MGGSAVFDPLVGQLLDERYRVESLIARGGMATVYEATDLRLDRTVAVKVMPHALADDESFTRRFVREARAAARLTHPNVVAVYDQGEDSGVLFLAMEYVAGRRTLRHLIHETAPLDPRPALALFEEILAAISAAHESGIVHRDIKPENVLITPGGQVKVADFGLARAITAATTSTSTAGVLMGTVSYLPPELVTDGIADARSDVYALGVLLFELLTGTKPHAGDSPIQIAYKHVHHDVPAPSTVEPGIPPYLDAFVARATARDRGQRPADARVLMRQLHRVRHALDNDVANDEELTADLAPSLSVLPAPRVTAGSTAYTSDPTDDVFDFAAYDDFDSDPTRRPGPDFVRTGGPEHTLVVTDTSLGSGPGSGPAELPVRAREPAATAGASGTANSVSPVRARRRGGGWVALLVVLLLAAGAATAGWYYGVGRFHSTPNVIGLGESRARATMERAGLSVRVGASAYSETIPARHVVSTDPSPGADVLQDATVTVVLSKGPERHEMPDLTGLSRSAAVAAIRGNALSVGELKRTWHESVEKGTVISFQPKAGTALMRGDAVRLLVSKGPEPIRIKDFTGTPAAGAVRRLETSGLVVQRVERYSDHTAKGLVLRQEPASGVRYAGDSVRLVVSLGQHLVSVPDVSNYGLDAAKTALEDAGFTVAVTQYEAYFGLGFVVSQTPGAGDLAPYGSEIVIEVV